MGATSYIAGMLSLRRISAVSGLLAFFGLGGATGCLYDADNRCDPGQTYDAEAGLCVCAAGTNTVTGDHGCVPCAEHEVATDDTCQCADGYSRANSGAACEIMAQGQGDACTKDDDCSANPAFKSCQLDGDSGYCTNDGCATSDDCVGGYACNTTASPTFCERPPTGQGMACTASADCAGTEATYCETFSAHTCFVDCSADANVCFVGYECCDLSPLSGGLIKNKICVASGSCGN